VASYPRGRRGILPGMTGRQRAEGEVVGTLLDYRPPGRGRAGRTALRVVIIAPCLVLAAMIVGTILYLALQPKSGLSSTP